MKSQVLVGSSGVINVQNMQWLNSEVTRGIKKNQKKHTIKTGYEIFAQYANITEDTYWKEIFNKASTGRLPSSVKLLNDQIVHRYKNKRSTISLSSGVYEIINFLSAKLGWRSPHDVDVDNNVYTEHRNRVNEKTYKSWNQIKSNGLKRQLVVSFSAMKKIEYKLSDLEYYQLKSIININLSLDNIKSSDIVMENKFIKEIKNLIWMSPIRKFTILSDNIVYTSQTFLDIDNIVDPHNTQSFNINKKIKLLTWKDYLKTLKKTNNIGISSYVRSTPMHTPMYTPSYTPMYTPSYTPMYTPSYTPMYTPSYGQSYMNTPSYGQSYMNTPQLSNISINTTPISCDLTGFVSPIYTPTIMSP